jgi:hypothetical protein
VTGVELAVGYVIAWAIRKAQRVAGRADGEVDQVLDAGMDRLHKLVVARLGTDPALEQALAEAGSDQEDVTDRTRMRFLLALEEQAQQDPVFAAVLEETVAKVHRLAGAAGPTVRAVYGNSFNGQSAVQFGDYNTQRNAFGA